MLHRLPEVVAGVTLIVLSTAAPGLGQSPDPTMLTKELEAIRRASSRRSVAP